MAHFFYRDLVEATAQRYGLDANLVHALVLQESSGQPHATRFEPHFWLRYMEPQARWKGEHPLRWASSIGLMQIMPTSAEEVGFDLRQGPEDLFKPVVNLDVGCKILAERLRWAGGDVRRAVASYNGGKGNYTGKRAQQYADEVLAKYEDIKQRWKAA